MLVSVLLSLISRAVDARLRLFGRRVLLGSAERDEGAASEVTGYRAPRRFDSTPSLFDASEIRITHPRCARSSVR